MVYRDSTGIIFPYSLLRTSKISSAQDRKAAWLPERTQTNLPSADNHACLVDLLSQVILMPVDSTKPRHNFVDRAASCGKVWLRFGRREQHLVSFQVSLGR